ncbi:MAG: Sua5/YciO/YrdC/YwlC family protein [Anaeromyxobacteraceae bacterium]|nr:Sua5/YciO/YrdC/YwlC family protein [Anaeromyxobacteraceae bacterium]
MQVVFTRDVAEAASALRRGSLVVYPTETFYGLGALATLPAALARLAAAKLRPADKPLPLVAADDAMAFALWAAVPAEARVLAGAFWPGPLTLVAAAAPGLPGPVTLGGAVGVRVPGSELARELCRLAGGPVISTSANPSGGPAPASVEELDPELLSRVDLVLDGGPTSGGLPSTVVQVGDGGPRLLRAGAVPWEAVEAVLRSSLPSRGA